MFEIWDDPLQLQPLIDAVSSPEAGAVVTFQGTVRARSRGESVQFLEYEAHRPMAEKALREIGETAAQEWGSRVAITHRLGRLAVGETSILVAVSAPHRREAFAACQQVMDRVQEFLPVWKKEVTVSGSWWVEGAETVPIAGTHEDDS